MKSLIKMTLVSSAIVLALVGCNEKKSTDANADKAKITTDAQKEAYALGSSFASYMKGNLDQNQIKTDADYVISGFAETYRGASQQTEEEVKTILDGFGQRLQAETKARIEKESKENTEAGDKFRADFAKQDGVKKTDSGLLYKIVQEGSGRHPTADDTVIVHYTGTLTDGRKFDSSYDRGETATFPLNGVIKGWTEGIQLIGVGGKIKLVLPPDLAYGSQSMPGQGQNAAIGPDSTLVFEVELLGIDDQNQDQQKPKAKLTN
ncbi:FKBP-type peptidyl-prolyl cis-trans isomerase [Orbaceae bacterium ESL0727]|nr:FKBP-type peptidyl-prolyl cis-trans isomerase [Orbaceae bacterium ESL0727]